MYNPIGHVAIWNGTIWHVDVVFCGKHLIALDHLMLTFLYGFFPKDKLLAITSIDSEFPNHLLAYSYKI